MRLSEPYSPSLLSPPTPTYHAHSHEAAIYNLAGTTARCSRGRLHHPPLLAFLPGPRLCLLPLPTLASEALDLDIWLWPRRCHDRYHWDPPPKQGPLRPPHLATSRQRLH